MIFDALNYEAVLEAVTPVAEAMQKLGSNSMKVSLNGDDDKPLITVVVARDDKAALVSKAIDLIDAAYDAGSDGNSMDGLNDLAAELVNDAHAAGVTAEENRPEVEDEDYLCHDGLHFEDDDDYDDDNDDDPA